MFWFTNGLTIFDCYSETISIHPFKFVFSDKNIDSFAFISLVYISFPHISNDTKLKEAFKYFIHNSNTYTVFSGTVRNTSMRRLLGDATIFTANFRFHFKNKDKEIEKGKCAMA